MMGPIFRAKTEATEASFRALGMSHSFAHFYAEQGWKQSQWMKGVKEQVVVYGSAVSFHAQDG